MILISFWPRARIAVLYGRAAADGSVAYGAPSSPRIRRRASPRDAAEDGAGHEAGAAGVVVEEEAGDRVAGRVFDLGVTGDVEAAEGEGDAGRRGIGSASRP